MSKPKIVIEINEGVVTNISSNTDIEVAILDHDNVEHGGPLVDAVYGQDSLFKNGEAYKLIDDFSEEGQAAIEFLKKLNF